MSWERDKRDTYHHIGGYYDGPVYATAKCRLVDWGTLRDWDIVSVRMAGSLDTQEAKTARGRGEEKIKALAWEYLESRIREANKAGGLQPPCGWDGQDPLIQVEVWWLRDGPHRVGIRVSRHIIEMGLATRAGARRVYVTPRAEV